jgi:putative oxidoreductase
MFNSQVHALFHWYLKIDKSKPGANHVLWEKAGPYFAAIGRLLIALLFLISAFGKIKAPEMTQGYIASVGLPVPFLSYVLAIAIEVLGGALLVLGFLTRGVALGMAIFTVATAATFHHTFTDQDQVLHFLKNIAIAGGLFQIVAFGAGTLSIDHRQRPYQSSPASSN